jgi:GGDEF domain-containing protein
LRIAEIVRLIRIPHSHSHSAFRVSAFRNPNCHDRTRHRQGDQVLAAAARRLEPQVRDGGGGFVFNVDNQARAVVNAGYATVGRR